jgi:hypothetical protein
MKSVYMSLPDIIDQLRLLGKEKETGSFFIVSDEQHAAIFGFERGHIVSIQCRLRFGEKAIPLIGKIRGGTCRFEPTASFFRKSDFGENEEVFRKIFSAREQSGDVVEKVASENAVKKTAHAGRKQASMLSDKQKRKIEDLLVEELGPMGSIVMDSIENCSDVSEIMDVIMTEVDGSEIVSAVALKIKEVLK